MTDMYKPWNIKVKNIFFLLVFAFSMSFVLFIIFLSIQPQTISNINKEEFLRLKRNHKVRTLNENAEETLCDMSDMKQFKDLLEPFLIPRVSGTDGNRKVQKHITDHMKKLKWHIDEDTFTDNTPYGSKEFTNIIATQNRNLPRKLTLACHFDSKYFADINFVGATDSAVPCAMLLDLAVHLNSLLENSPTKVWDISLQLLFFDGEEAFKTWTHTDSIYGARHLARQMENTKVDVGREVNVNYLRTIDLFVLLDLIGAANPRFRDYFTATSGHFKALQSIEKRLASRGQLQPAGEFTTKTSNTYFIGGKGIGNIEDDHIPFLQRNVPILHLISYPFPKVWHKETDNESALDYKVIDNLNKIMRVFVASYLYLF